MGLELEQRALCAERAWPWARWLAQPVRHRVAALAERRVQGLMRAVEDQERRLKQARDKAMR